MTAVTRAQPGPGLTWRLRDKSPADIGMLADGEGVTPQWAWGGATGRGVRVCVVDSGVEPDHPMVGPVDGSWVVAPTGDGSGGVEVVPTEPRDVCGHGTACAGIIRSLSPECELHSVRVLGDNF